MCAGKFGLLPVMRLPRHAAASSLRGRMSEKKNYRNNEVDTIHLRLDVPTLWVACRVRGYDFDPGDVARTVPRELFPPRVTPEGKEVRSVLWVGTAKGFYAHWLVLGDAAAKLGVPMELLVDEEHYVKLSGGFTTYRIICEAHRKGIRDLREILPPFYQREGAYLQPIKHFLVGRLYGKGGICNPDDPVCYNHYRLTFGTVLWILHYLGMPAWMLAAPVKRIPGVLGATEASATVSTLWKALTREDRAAAAGIMKVLAERRGVGERLEGIREVLEAVEARRMPCGERVDAP